eukprot:TRINITY_DN16767_c0_g1_i1.p1 TRINITY_DN16767_c0_g1~~TRINITY_DN16767_c0_g1_i1.p1  ORF type:complete len:126 (+),score=39.28 TRINITY_DN16767_c0_g1_i1:64-441(+)
MCIRDSCNDDFQPIEEEESVEILLNQIDAWWKKKNKLENMIQRIVLDATQHISIVAFNQLKGFMKDKLESEEELKEDDQNNFESLIQVHIKENVDLVLSFIFKILYLEIELEKCNSNIHKLEEQL